jgi:spermidine/putrescine-binding protein
VLSNITAFDSFQYTDRLINGEVAVSHGYSGTFFGAFDGADDPDNFAYVIPKEGATVWIDNMVVPKTATSQCTAWTFINFLLDAENGAMLSELEPVRHPECSG